MPTVREVADYLDEKMEKNDKLIKCTFYELRIKKNLTQDETEQFLGFCKNRLKNNNYKVYTTGQQYIYENETKVVQDNELLIAIRN